MTASRAEADLIEIGVYGVSGWGEAQALLYAEEGSHVLFFKFDAAGMLVVRVLHGRMMPTLHVTAQDEDE